MNKFLFKDDLVIQVLYALFSITAFLIGIALIWLMFEYSSGLTLIGKSFAYVLAPIFVITSFYLGALWLGVAVARPESKWAKKGFGFSASSGGEEIFLAIPYYLIALIIAAMLRVIGINGYEGKNYSSVIFAYKNKAK